MDSTADLVACVWQEYLDATAEDEPYTHRRRVLRNAYWASDLPHLGVPLRAVEDYARCINVAAAL